MWGCLFLLAAVAAVAQGAGAGAARLVCYVEGARAAEMRECTHLVYAGDARGDKLDALLKEYRKINPRVKIVLRAAEVDKDLRTLFKSKHVQGLELHDVHKTLNKTKVLETVEAARSAITSSGGGPLFLSLPAHPELLAKYYDLRVLMKKVDLMMVETHNLGAVKKMTYHPSRLSGLWDMMNTDSVVDLVVGLGVPASKVVITLPAIAQQFTLENETLSTPGSPTLEDDPKEIGQDELCRQLQKGRWTLERDQDLSAPYAFKEKTWISFEDASSVDVKGKYARVRGLAGLALYGAERDVENPCGPTLKASLAKVLNQQSRAPRAAVLRSLEHEILSAPQHGRALEALQVSPYRITQVVDSDGVIHSIREDTRTEFSCSRQGYFVHPRSCARFYRCVKFDQLSPEYTVFEFDCPAGLAFDSRYEVCVWPGSLPDSQACPGSSEIAPVPNTRFICPEHEGYYADPENCRWFFACLDHGKAPLTAYEFRCPFGLGFDAERLTCDWPWLVPACGNIARYEAQVHGYSAATLSGAAGFHGQTADSVNIAAHQSLVSGASLDNLVGIQGGFLTHEDALDANFIASQELANGANQYSQKIQAGISHDSDILSHGSQGSYDSQGSGLTYQVGDASSQTGNIGLVQPRRYDNEEKYTSGSLILDDYRLPTKKTGEHGNALNGNAQVNLSQGSVSQSGYRGYSIGQADDSGSIGYSGSYSSSNVDQRAEGYKGYSTSSFAGNLGQKSLTQNSDYDADNSGAYVHDPTGDTAEPYKHEGSPVVPYIHDSNEYKDSSNYYDYNRYKGASQSDYEGRYVENNGRYVQDNSGAYVESSAGYKDSSGAYVDSSNRYNDNAGAYIDSSAGYRDISGAYVDTSARYKDNSGAYIDFSSGNKDNVDLSNGYKATSSGVYIDTLAGYNGYKADYSGAYIADYSGSYNKDNSGQYEAGVYRAEGHIGGGDAKSTSSISQSYSQANAGNYISDSKAYTGSSHTLTAGAVNVGLVGKTTLVDAGYTDQGSYQGQSGYTQSVSHQSLHPGHVSIVSQPAVSIKHVGTDENNLDGYGYVTTPTSSGVPTTATPFAVTTALPAVTTYKTTFVPEAPKSTIKQIFGYTQPAVTYVQPTVVAVKQQYVTSERPVETDYNQGLTYQYKSKDYSTGNHNEQQSANYNRQSLSQSEVKSESSGYDYSKPSIGFEDGFSYTTSAPAVTVSTYKPQGVAQVQQNLHEVESVGFHYSTPSLVPVTEEPFRKAYAYTTGPAITTFEQPSVSTYVPQAFSHQTIHKVETSNVQLPSVDLGSTGYSSGVTYEAPKTAIKYSTAQPAITAQSVISTYQPQVFSQQTLHKVDANRINTYSQDSSSGYSYEKPAVKFEEGTKPVSTFTTPAPTAIQYSTPVPTVVSTYRPQAYSHQTLHKFDSKPLVTVSSTPLPEYEYQSTPVTVYQNPFLKFTQPKVTPVTYVQSTYKPQAYSQQTIHKIENNKVYSSGDVGYEFTKSVAYDQPQTVIQYTTSQPAIAVQPAVSTYQPQVYSQQTLHKVDASQVNTYSDSKSGYQYLNPEAQFEESPKAVFTYSTPAPAVVSTYKPHAFSQQTIHKVEAESGYEYSKPAAHFDEAPKTVFSYSTPAPAVVSTYKPHAFSQQTIHKVEAESGYEYSKPIAKLDDAPETVFTYSTPAPAIVSTYKPHAFSQQTIHKVEAQSGNEYSKPIAQFDDAPKSVFSYSTPAPAVVSTYKPHAFSQQTIHKVEAESGYDYSKPSTRFEEAPRTVFTHSTPAPATISTYKPQTYSQQTIHKVEQKHFLPVSSTVAPELDLTYQTPSVSTYENPILKYTQKNTPVTYVNPTATIYTQTYQPIVQQHEVSHVLAGQYEGQSQQSYKQNLQLNQESYNQPEIQRNIETARKEYSDASIVSHQTFHLANVQSESDSGKKVVFVSSTPATLAYEEHYSEYEAPRKIESYNAPAYIQPKTEYQQSFSTVTTTPIVQQHYIHSQDDHDGKLEEFSQQYETVQKTVPVQHVSFSTSHVLEPKKVESYHISSFPRTKVTTKYQPATYDNPEIQVGYKAEEYLPPVVSTTALEVTPTYSPRTYSTTTREYLPPTFATASTTREYLPPPEPEYNAPEYLPPSTTTRSRVKSTTPNYKYTESTTYKATEYLPSSEEQGVNVVNYESFGFDKIENSDAPKIRYNPYQEINVAEEVSVKPAYRKQNIVVETAKSNLLGFGTVGPDAGLVSSVSYTTAAPVASSTYSYRPRVKSTTQAPTYQYFESSTAYKAAEYLPPADKAELNIEGYGAKNVQQGSISRYQENDEISKSPPIQRKQNIVVQTAKANQLGFGTVGSDAGLVSQVAYTASTPVVVSSTESYTESPERVRSTYAPVEQGLFEVSPSPVPRRRVIPKVAVVTKINDFNPLLVRKLGAVCSCQSPVLILKGKRPNIPQTQDFDDYTNEYDDSNRGDITDNEWAQKSARIQTTVTTTPIVTSTFNPIIVPEDSYYQDYQDASNYNVAVTPKNSQVIVSSTPAVTSTQRVVRIRPRIKAVTVAPTYETVLLNKEAAPSASKKVNQDSTVSEIDSQSFDRYGPGGWRSRDETLQGSVDCKRAGLFRHPKQCNKFYACRWDCTKQRFTLHVFNCPVQLSFDPSIGACNWPSQGPACQGDTLLTNAL